MNGNPALVSPPKATQLNQGSHHGKATAPSTPPPPTFLNRCTKKVLTEAPPVFKALQALSTGGSTKTPNKVRLFAAGLITVLLGVGICLVSRLYNADLGLAVCFIGGELLCQAVGLSDRVSKKPQPPREVAPEKSKESWPGAPLVPFFDDSDEDAEDAFLQIEPSTRQSVESSHCEAIGKRECYKWMVNNL